MEPTIFTVTQSGSAEDPAMVEFEIPPPYGKQGETIELACSDDRSESLKAGDTGEGVLKPADPQ
jgi:hypothetical protein